MYTSRTVCLPWGHRRHVALESFMWLSSLVREINITITLILNKTNTSKLFVPTQWSDKRHYNQNEDIQIKRKKEVTTTFSKSTRKIRFHRKPLRQNKKQFEMTFELLNVKEQQKETILFAVLFYRLISFWARSFYAYKLNLCSTNIFRFPKKSVCASMHVSYLYKGK